MAKKSKIASFIVLGGYIFNIIVYIILHYIFHEGIITGDNLVFSAAIIFGITILYLLIVLAIFSMIRYKKPWPSLIILSFIVTSFTFLSITFFFYEKYNNRKSMLSLKKSEIGKTFDVDQKNKIGFMKPSATLNRALDPNPEDKSKHEKKLEITNHKEILKSIEKVKEKIGTETNTVTTKVDAEAEPRREPGAGLTTDYILQKKALRQIGKTDPTPNASENIILNLQKKLESERNNNKELINQLKEIILQVEDKDRIILALQAKLKEESKIKEDVFTPPKSKTLVSGENKKKIKIDKTASDIINHGIIFKVQIHSSNTPLPINFPKFKGIKNVWEYREDGLYKYTVGNKRDLKSAIKLQSELRQQSFKDAFVVAFQNMKRIPVKTALNLLK